MTTATANGKPQRKQLSDQLDRLDSIIDALAEGLPGAVADACREGARQAVKDAIIEIVSNPELRALIAPAQSIAVPVVPAPAPAPESSKPGLWTRLKAKLAAAREAITGAAAKAKEAVTTRCKVASETVEAVSKSAGEALNWKRVLWLSLCTGLAVGLICLIMPQAFAATVSAVSVTATSVAFQTGRWLHRAAKRFGLAS